MTTPTFKKLVSLVFAVATLVVLTRPAFGANGTWTADSDGNWSDTTKWAGGTVADATGSSADFSTVDITGNRTVTLDSARTISSLIFGDAGASPNYNWTLTGPNVLTLGTTPLINVTNQTATISLPIAGTAGLTKTGPGTLILSGANTFTGNTTVSTGTLAYSGLGSSSGGGSLLVGTAAGNTAVMNLGGSGTWNFYGTFNVGGATTGVGAINQAGGTVSAMNSSGYIQVGNGGYGAYVLSGGTLSNVGSSGIRVGFGAMGSFLQTGGTYNCNRYFAIGGSSASGNGVVTVTGGNLVINTYRFLIPDAASATGVLNIGTLAGGNAMISHYSTDGLMLENGAGGNGTLNLNGGTLLLRAPIHRNNSQGGSAMVNLNGGTLQAGSASVTLIDATPSSVNVYNGGVAVDTIANTATVSAALLATAGNGIYPAGGTFAFSSGGGSGYIGAPLVTVTSSGAGTGAMAIANIAGGVVTGVTMTCPGQNYAVGDTLTFAFAGGGYATAASTFSHVLTAGELAPNVIGSLVKNGTGTLNLTATNSYAGGTIVNAGTLNVTADSGLGAGNVNVADGAILALSGGVTNGYIRSSANLVLAATAVANLNFTGTNTVNGLSVDGGATYLAVGTYGSSGSSAASYDDTHFTGTGVIQVTAQPVGATVSLVSSLNPAEALQTITFTATVNGLNGTPTGTVTLKDGTAALGTVALNGSGVGGLATSSLLIGTHTITAVYNGNPTYAAAVSSPVNQVITPRNDVWTGAINNIWDVGTTANWKDLGSAAVYHDTYDLVRFDDTVTGSTDVSLGVTVTPYSVVVSNSSKSYSLGGAGAISGATGLTKLGTGALTISNANSYTGSTLIQAGTVNYDGASASSGNGGLSLSNGVVNIRNSGTLTFGGNTTLGGVAGNGTDAGSATVNQASGTVNLGNDSTYLELGAGDTSGTPGNYSSYGCYILAGGSLSTVNGSGVRVGASGMGVFRQTGGTFYCDRWFAIGSGSGGSGTGGGYGEASFTGGTASLNSSRRILVGDKANGTGVFNLGTLAGGNAVITAPYNSGGRGALEFIDSSGAYSGTANFNSGTLTLAGAIYRNSTLGETVALNFNGGTIQASGNLNLVDPTIQSATVFNGGLVVDSQAYTVTNSVSLQPAYGNGIYPVGGAIAVTGGGSGYVGAPIVTVSGGSGYGAMAIADLVNGAVSRVTMTCPGQSYQVGDTVSFDFIGGGATTPAGTFNYVLTAGDVAANNGGLTKLGAGTMILSGNNSYTGPTLVKNGTLVINTAYANSTGDYIITNGGTLNLGVGYAGSQQSMNNLTFAGLTAGTVVLDLNTAGSIAAAPIYINGSLHVTGVATIQISIGGLAVGQYPLIQYGNLTGTGSFALGGVPVGTQAHLVTNTTTSPNSIDLVVTSSGQPRWDGQVGGTVNSTWDINSTANWVDALTFQSEPYKEGQPVLFDDNASGTTTVNLTANAHPGDVIFKNNNLSYIINGSGKISGTTGVEVMGSGNVTINTLNDYTGATVVGGGTLNVTKLANGGLASSIGAATAGADGLVLTNGGSLHYSGSAAAIDRGYTVGMGGGVINLDANLALSGHPAVTSGATFTKTGPAMLTYSGAGTNLLTAGGGAAAYNIVGGTVALDGGVRIQTNVIAGELWIGSTAGGPGFLAVTNSSLGVSSWVAIDRGDGTDGFQSIASIYNSFFACGNLSLGYANSVGGYSARPVLNLGGTSTMADAGLFYLGESAGADVTMNVADSAALNVGNNAVIGNGQSRGVLNITTTGALTFNNSFQLGGLIGNTGTVNGSAAVNQTAGSVNAGTAGNYLEIGAGTNAYGYYNLAGGTLSAPDNGNASGMRVGATGTGAFVQSGGTLVCSRYFAVGSGTGGNNALTGGNGVATFLGGTATVGLTGNYRIIIGDKSDCTGVMNIGTEAGGSALVASISGNTGNGGIDFVDLANATGTLNLNRGTLQTVMNIYRGNTGTANFNFNGGTLQAGGAGNGTLISATAPNLNVYKKGAVIDSQGFTTAVLSPLLATVGNGVYPAGGTLAISSGGGNGYIGTPLVTATTTGSGTGLQAVATIAGGVVTGVVITCPGQNYVAGDVVYFAFNGGAATTPADTIAYTLQAGDLSANSTGGLTKLGTGTLTLSAANTYTGATTVSNGTLLVNGSLAADSAVTVAFGGTLGGTGTIGGAVALNSGATLSPGAGLGALTINGNLTMNAGVTNVFEVNASTLANDTVLAGAGVAYNGVLKVVPTGTFSAGQQFVLFSGAGAANAGNFTSVVGSPGAGLQFNFTNGILSVVSVSTAPAFLTNSVSGNTLIFTWPAGQGWTLQSETNSLSVGLTTNAADWKAVSGGVDGSNGIAIDPKQPTVFYRLAK